MLASGGTKGLKRMEIMHYCQLRLELRGWVVIWVPEYERSAISPFGMLVFSARQN
jgi:hypothetical protein